MNEDRVEQETLKILESLGFRILYGPVIGADCTYGTEMEGIDV